jgi:hypothetical protein
MKAKLAITLLLFLVPLLTVAQTVQSQQYATTTITTLVTNIQSSTVAIGTMTATTMLAQSSAIFSAPVLLPGTHGVCGVYFVQALNASEGEVVFGTVTSNNNVDLYLMTASVFQAWNHQVVAGGTCTPSSLIISQLDTTAYNFTATIPSNGVYDIVLNNLSHSSVTAKLTVDISTSAPLTMTTAMYSTMNQQVIETEMQTSVQTVQSTSGGQMDMGTLGAVVLVIVIIAAIALAVGMKRRSTATK